MEIIKREKKLCTCCMEEHEVNTVRVQEETTYKGYRICYNATYYHCSLADEFYMDEEQIKANDICLKNVYRKQKGLLTSLDISNIRSKYQISQRDLCILLGWGEKTITRYEGHQIQDKAHDAILKKIDEDSEWYISLLINSKDSLEKSAYQRYLRIATLLYEQEKNDYLRKAILADYAPYHDNTSFCGNTKLSLDKVVDMIRYFASSKHVTNLYKVKLMKLMWYADFLSYKLRGFAITGLVYQALPMGAVPIAHNSIINLKDVPCQEVDVGETTAYHFSLNETDTFPSLTNSDMEILDIVINSLGSMSKNQIVTFMHKEQAYLETPQKSIIDYRYAQHLQI